MFWTVIIGLGLAWVLQSFLSFQQTRAYSRLFVEMRRRGRVAIGKFRGGIAAGSIVMFGLDDEDRITEGMRLGGVTVVARFQPFEVFTGQYLADIDPGEAARFGKPALKAVRNAKDNFRIISGGAAAPEPPNALARLVDKLPGFKSKPKQLEIQLPSPVAKSKIKVPVATPTPSNLRRKQTVASH